LKIFTLVSGDYAHGAVALINSLRKNGFDGEVILAHEGELKIDVSRAGAVNCLPLAPNGRWIGGRKAELLLSERGECVFIDADCIVASPRLLQIAAKSLADRPLFCSEGLLPVSDYRRRVWAEAASAAVGVDYGLPNHSIYYNSGFLAVNAGRDRPLLEAWRSLTDTLTGSGALGDDPRFPMADQDCLNAFLQSYTDEFASLSPPDVWYAASQGSTFIPVGSAEGPLLLHCTGPEKSWRILRVPDRRAHEYDRAWGKYCAAGTGPAHSDPRLPHGVTSWLKGGAYGRALQARARWGRFVSGR
jgi:hypothetical protein